MLNDIAKVMISAEEIAEKVKELGKSISEDYKDKNLFMVSVLKGSFIFMADLIRAVDIHASVDFMAVSSYGMTATSGAVRIVLDLREPIEDRHVLLVEDIVDSGHTLHYLQQVLASRGPASLRTCALSRKQRPEAMSVPVDYLGFTIPDVWVVGYGLDFADTHRTLPYIGALKKEVYQ